METTTTPQTGHIDSAAETVRWRWKCERVLAALLLLVAVLAGGALLLFGLDNLLHLSSFLRIILGVGLVGSLGVLWVRTMLLPLLKPVTRAEAVIMIERAMPELDNRLINAERLRRDPRTPIEILDLLQLEASRMLAQFDPRAVLPLRALKRLAVCAAISVSLLAVYAVVLPDHFANALKRYTMPRAFIPPLTSTRLHVEPGNITIMEGLKVTIRAEVGGEIPGDAQVKTGNASYEMRFLGGYFAYEFQNVESNFDYSVQAGDAQSDVYHVTVLTRPKIQKLAVKYTLPDYLKAAPKTEDPSGGNITAVEGTLAEITVTTTKPALDLRMIASEGIEPRGSGNVWSFVVGRSGQYHFVWHDPENKDVELSSAVYNITAQKDLPPTVRLLEPSRDMSIKIDGEFTAIIQASDDFGLASIAFKAAKSDKDVAVISEAEVSGKQSRISKLIKVAELKAKIGETIGIFATARDMKGNLAASGIVHLRIVADAQSAEEARKDLAGIIAKLRQAIETQKNIRNRTVQPKTDVEALVKDQGGLLAFLTAIHAGWNNQELIHMGARGHLQDVIQGPATQALQQLRSDLPAASKTQEKVIANLERIVAELEGILATAKKEGIEKALDAAAEKTPRQVAKDLVAGLKEFTDVQKKVIQESMDLKPTAADDFSDAQKKKLETLKQTEEQWGKFFQEKSTDLSKLAPQDMTNGNTVKELNSIFSELKQAAQALDKKATEIAVPAEQSGLELAKEITSNIEKWLSGAPDDTKWNMEEPNKENDVPMQDLPSELEDIVGDLMDKEDKLADEAQDVSSSWQDSMDKGVGWGVSDGPISDMSAKGITGNLNPNSNEVNGRSGEGRSGKSSGSMVEDTAVGKGGKQTPTRSTPDPFEAGRVKDSSKDPTGGSTGGGKISGANKEGLRGVPPPPTKEKMDRLADEQADLRNQAEKAKVAMKKRGYVSEDLSDAIDKMKKVEGQLREYRTANYKGEARTITERLRGVKKTIEDQIEVTRDMSKPLAKQRRDELYNALDEDVPPEFKDWVTQYYKSLSE